MANGYTIAPQYTGPRLFGAPVGDFSLAQTLLLTFAAGFASFFAATFLAIITMLIITQVSHTAVDYSRTYRWFGLPIGITVLVVTGVYLSSLLVMRLRRGGDRARS